MPIKNFQNVVVPPKIAGIKTVLPAHTLAWLINKSFSIGLAKTLDWQKEITDGNTSTHNHFFCHFEDVELNWHLIQNKGSHLNFCVSNPMFDYLFICNGEDIYNYFERAVEAIKPELKNSTIYPFDFSLLKQKESYFENFIKTKRFIEDLHV